MPFIEIDDQKINYKIEGSGKNVVLMHGWGQNLQMMDYIFNHLKNNFRVLSFDFLGFGESDEPKKSIDVQEYTEIFKKMLDVLDIENPILIGHSFGCRVAIRYAFKNPVNKMILTGAAGIKPKRSVFYHIKTSSYKFIKKALNIFGLKKLSNELATFFGSSDYKNSTGVMRETLIKVVNDDVRDILGFINCPVLLVWGEKDEAVSIEVGKQMSSLIKDSALVVFENDDHFAYFNQWARFNRVIDAMLEEDINE